MLICIWLPPGPPLSQQHSPRPPRDRITDGPLDLHPPGPHHTSLSAKFHPAAEINNPTSDIPQKGRVRASDIAKSIKEEAEAEEREVGTGGKEETAGVKEEEEQKDEEGKQRTEGRKEQQQESRKRKQQEQKKQKQEENQEEEEEEQEDKKEEE